jgi:MoaA/NifB/PqqE/SkfB family radical SAM enzyme
MTKTQITHLKLARYPELLVGPPSPIHWDVDPSTVCDHACRGCPYIFDGPIDPMLGVIRPEVAKDKRTLLDFEMFLSFLEQAIGSGCKAITFVGGGEPTIHPRFSEMMEACTRRSVKFGVITHLGRKYNVNFFEALRRATWVRVSVNAATRATYLKHQGKDHFDQAIENIATASLSFGTRIGMSFLITNDNYHEIEFAAKIAKDACARYIQYKPIIELDLGAAYRGIEDEIRDYLKVAAEYADDRFQVLDQWAGRLEELGKHAKHGFAGKCHVARFNPKLGANGVVYQCCELAYSDEGALGSIYDEPLADILARADELKIDMKTCPHCWAKPGNKIINDGQLQEVQPPIAVSTRFV